MDLPRLVEHMRRSEAERETTIIPRQGRERGETERGGTERGRRRQREEEREAIWQDE